MDIQTWFEQEFKPWQDEMKKREEERKNYGAMVKNNARAIKHVVALIHAGSGVEAAQAWNALGFPVVLKDIQLTQDGDWLEITPAEGERLAMPMDHLISVLNDMLKD